MSMERSLRVLVVDDYPDCADALAQLTRLYGCQVEIAYDGPSAIDIAEEFRPDIILLDIALPGMDGVAVARELRHRPEMREAIIVAVTGHGREQDQERYRLNGFDHFILKPGAPGDIENILHGARRQLRCAVSDI
jgi:CheY-like chemotaxis protein